jgi:hypothetical protein
MLERDAPGTGSPIVDAPIDPNAVVDWDADTDEPTTPPAPGSAPAAPAVPPAAQPPAPPPAQPSAPPAPPPPSTPAATAPGAPAAAIPPAAPAASTPSAWEFSADGQTVEVDGSIVHPDGSITVPKAQVEHLNALLAEGVHHRGTWRDEIATRDARIAELEAQVGNTANDPDILKARAYNQQILAIMAKGPEAVAAWLDDYERRFPEFQAKAQQAVLEAQIAERDAKLATYQEKETFADITPKIETTIQAALGDSATKYPSVNAEKLYERIVNRYWDQIVYEVTAAQRPRGLEAGEELIGQGPKGQYYIVNTGMIADEFAYQASLLQGSAAAATAAVEHNRAMAAPAAPSAAVPAGAVATPPPGGAPVQLPKTREEMQKWIDSGEWRKTVFPSTT